MSHLPDEALARRAAVGRIECFEELLRRYRVRVYRICYRMAGNAEDAEDWAQECFVRVYSQLAHFDPGRPFAPWLLRIVSNRCVDLLKARSSGTNRLSIGLENAETFSAAENGPLNAAFEKERAEAANAALERLSPVLRQTIVVWLLEDLTFRELGEALGIPLSTAAQRVRRGLEQMRAYLERKGFEIER